MLQDFRNVPQELHSIEGARTAFVFRDSSVVCKPAAAMESLLISARAQFHHLFCSRSLLCFTRLNRLPRSFALLCIPWPVCHLCEYLIPLCLCLLIFPSFQLLLLSLLCPRVLYMFETLSCFRRLSTSIPGVV